ncbi:unnamed protein product [Rhodiola kirilowii]
MSTRQCDLPQRPFAELIITEDLPQQDETLDQAPSTPY